MLFAEGAMLLNTERNDVSTAKRTQTTPKHHALCINLLGDAAFTTYMVQSQLVAMRGV